MSTALCYIKFIFEVIHVQSLFKLGFSGGIEQYTLENPGIFSNVMDRAIWVLQTVNSAKRAGYSTLECKIIIVS